MKLHPFPVLKFVLIIRRVLKQDNGVFLYLTFGQPHFRRRYLIRANTTLEVREMGEAFHYYLYIVRTQGSESER